MSKKSDDSIERIFRQALTQYETTFQESDWVKMEKMLNEEANRRAAARSKRIKGTAYTLTGLTGLIIAVYFLAFRNPSGSIAELNNSVNEMQATGDLEKDGIVKLENPPDGLLSETPPSKSPGVLGGKEQADLSNKTLGEEGPRDQTDKNAKKGGVPPGEEGRDNGLEDRGNDPQVLTKGNTKSGNEPIDGRSTEPSGANLKTGAVVAAPATGVAGQNGSGADGAGEPADSDKTKAAGVGIVSATVPAAINSKTTEQITSSLPPGEKATQVAPDSIISSEEKNALAHRIDSLENTKAQPEEKQKTKPPYRLSIGIILAPEFSTTSLDEYSAPGGSFGLRIGYQVSNRLNIKTGIIRSMKKYEGDGYDYTPRNPLYWNNRTNGVVPEAIDSKCLVYELPVGVQFDAIQTEKSRVFLSAALSSYLMISQAYDYTFESPNPGADMGWRSSGSESYWFSVGMVSAGYERYVHRSFAIGIEPYLKISLR